MHEDTIKWLADTGGYYPPALRPQIQPRIDALRNWQPGRRQPPTPPQPNRWQEKRTERCDNLAAYDPTPPKPQTVQLSPRHMVADDKLYMVMQEEFLEIANTVPTPKGGSGKPARASQAAVEESSSKSPRQRPPDNTAKEGKRSKEKTARVEVGKIAAQRPAPPTPKEDARKTAKPSKPSPAKEMPKEKAQAQESSSYDSSSSSSSSSDAPEAPEEEEEPDQKEETEQSSEESNTPDLTQKAIDKADLPTLHKMQRAAEKRVDVLESELNTAKEFLRYILKHRKIVKAKESRDVEMERVD